MRSKAILVTEESEKKLNTYDVPEIGESHVLIKVLAAPFSSDYLLTIPRREERACYSYIPGTEAIGEVVKIGKQARKEYAIDEGDLVFVEPVILCKNCIYCLRGNYALCAQKKYYGHLKSTNYPFLLGSFSQYMVLLPGSRIHRLDRRIPLENYTLIGSFSRAIKCIVEKGEGSIGKSVAILGLSIFSLACALVAKISGLDPITVIEKEITPIERDLVSRFDLDVVNFVNKDKEYDLIINPNNSKDLIIDNESLFDHIKPEGRYILPLEYHNKVFTFPQLEFIQKELQVIGIFHYSWESKRALNLINNFELSLEKIPHKYYSLEEISKAAKVNKHEKLINVIIQPNRAN